MEAKEKTVRDFMAHRSKLFGFILSITGDFHAAEDIFQEVSVIVFKKAGDFTPGTDLGAWLREIARRKVYEHRRKVARTGLPLDDDVLDALESAFGDTGDSWEEEKQALRGCLDNLQKDQRSMISMRYEKALPLKRIAELSRKTAGAVQVALSRLRGILLDCMKRFLAAEDV